VKFASVRIITDDLDRLVEFYEQVTGVSAERPAPVFAELVMPGATLAIGHSDTVPLFAEGPHTRPITILSSSSSRSTMSTPSSRGSVIL
jgi:predicted enzyme related to lactoylglutathione lyase